jgi:hypothetical protein
VVRDDGIAQRITVQMPLLNHFLRPGLRSDSTTGLLRSRFEAAATGTAEAGVLDSSQHRAPASRYMPRWPAQPRRPVAHANRPPPLAMRSVTGLRPSQCASQYGDRRSG